MSGNTFSFWDRALYDQTYDLIVIGGGLTGQSAAYFFKKRNANARVMVVDRGFYPLGASTRNAGFACFGSVTEHIADLKLESEEKIIQRIARRIKGLNLLRQTLGDEHIDYQENGSYEIFIDRNNYERSLEYIDLCNKWLKNAAGLKDVYSRSEYHGYSAIKILHEGSLHPGKMIKRLYELNIESGVEFRWNTKVKDLDAEEGSVYLENDKELRASKLIVATNAFTSSFIKELKVTPGRGYIFVTAPITNLKWKGTFHYNKGYYYFRNIGNRLMLGGARNLNIDDETTIEFGVNPIIKDHLIDFAGTVLRLPKNWEIEQEWSGIMGFTANKTPYLKTIGAKCAVAVGLSGMGVALGMQLGKEVAYFEDLI